VEARAGGFERYITAPGLGDSAGIAGAFLLAMQATRREPAVWRPHGRRVARAPDGSRMLARWALQRGL